MQDDNNENSIAKQSTIAAKKKLEDKRRLDAEAKQIREDEIAERHYKKMQKRREAVGKSYPKPKTRVLPSVEENETTKPVVTPSDEPSPVEEVVDDVVRDKARGKEALKMIAKASSKGITTVSKSIGSDVLSPLLSMAILTEAPLLAAVFDKSLATLKVVSTGLFGFAKNIFSKKSEETRMPEPVSSPTDDPTEDSHTAFHIDVIDTLEDINNSIEFGNELFIGLVEGLAQGVEDFREDMKKANKVVPNNDAFLNQERLIENDAAARKPILETRPEGDKKAMGGFFGFLNGGTFKKITRLLMKITGISFVLGILGKLSPFGKTAGGKKFLKGSKFLKGFGAKMGKMMKFIMKPLRLLAGPVMTGLRIAFMALVGVVGTISAPVLIIIAVVAAIVAGLVLLARKLGDGDILKGFGVMWDTIKGFFTNLWGIVKTGFGNLVNKVTDFSSGLFTDTIAALTFGPKLITDKAMELIDFLAGIPNKVLGWIKEQVSKIPVVGNLLSGDKSDSGEVGIVKKTFGGAKDVISDALESKRSMGEFAVKAGKKAIGFNPVVLGGRIASGFFKKSDKEIQSNSNDFVNAIAGVSRSPLAESTNAKTEAQKKDFMKNMIKTRENSYYEKISRSSTRDNGVKISSSNQNVFNTTQVSHQRSSAIISKPVNLGY